MKLKVLRLKSHLQVYKAFHAPTQSTAEQEQSKPVGTKSHFFAILAPLTQMMQCVFLRYRKLDFFNFWAQLLVGEGLIGLPGYRIFRAFTRFVISFFLSSFLSFFLSLATDKGARCCTICFFLLPTVPWQPISIHIHRAERTTTVVQFFLFFLFLSLYNFLAIVLGISVGCYPWPKIY